MTTIMWALEIIRAIIVVKTIAGNQHYGAMKKKNAAIESQHTNAHTAHTKPNSVAI